MGWTTVRVARTIKFPLASPNVTLGTPSAISGARMLIFHWFYNVFQCTQESALGRHGIETIDKTSRKSPKGGHQPANSIPQMFRNHQRLLRHHQKNISFTMYLLVEDIQGGMKDCGGTLCLDIRFGLRPMSLQGCQISTPVHECRFFIGFTMFFHVPNPFQKHPHNRPRWPHKAPT